MKSHSMYSFVPGFFVPPSCYWDSSRLFFPLLPTSIPLYEHTIVCLSIFLLKTEKPSYFWIWDVMIKASVSNFVHILSAHMYAFLLNWKWHVGANDRCITLLEIAKQISKMAVLYSQQQCVRVPTGPQTQHFVLSASFDYSHSGGHPCLAQSV